ncbi:MAG: formyltetrahydrofolate deformylase [Planctomycetota bacterium]|nr:MAG: formyltetrahydrofolate deformylase [Planctomycetota bacterium]REJ97322.1 MAG: formyltetrahydrofolate deformylase [Planctomycetota bacterium]REK27767.1 MAG: formyltetrahydrofolate deformylase [Planctomycetota bacterium]REK48092.1 MAG: formyltetrahydrofolate deformylase [Planctomycetota bacterium]
MQVVITAVGPDNRGLADPIVHHVTESGANISEIQMFDHDEESVFAMYVRIETEDRSLVELHEAMQRIGAATGLSIRVWSPEERAARPRLAILTTYRPETSRALLQAIQDGEVSAEPTLMIGNRSNCRSVAEEFDVPWVLNADAEGTPDDDRLVQLCDEHEIDYIVMARYMRVLPPSTCWKYAGGRIVNLHHGLLPSFPGIRPYAEAHANRMLTYGATCHFIVPELDAGNQIIYQSTFTVPPGMPLDEIMRRGHAENEPHCFVEGVRRVVDREVQLHFHRVVAGKQPTSV